MKNTIPLQLHVPEPLARPGQAPDFSWLQIPEAGSVARPDTATEPQDMRPLAYTLIRVLDEAGAAIGPWNPRLDPVWREAFRLSEQGNDNAPLGWSQYIPAARRILELEAVLRKLHADNAGEVDQSIDPADIEAVLPDLKVTP